MERMMRILANVFNIAVVLTLWGYIAKFIFADGIELFIVESPLVFPFFVAAALTGLVAINLSKELKARKSAKASGENVSVNNGTVLKQLVPVTLFAGVTFVYILVLRYLHFIAGTFLFMALGMFLLNETTKKVGGRILKAGLACLITVPALYLCFNVLFDVALP